MPAQARRLRRAASGSFSSWYPPAGNSLALFSPERELQSLASIHYDRSDDAMLAFARQFLISVLALLICAAGFAAEDAPRPPCGTTPNPPYAELGAQPNVKVWNGSKQGIRIASSCPGIPAGEFKMVVAVSGTFRFDGDADTLLERIGAASAMQGIRYWSVTDEKWRDLITESAAIDGPSTAQRRADFSAAELKQGQDLFFAQRDSRSTGEILYRMRMLEATKERLVVETENVSPVRSYIFTLFKRGELRTIYYLTRQTSGVWNYYALTLIGASQSDSHIPSLINRAVALYRYVAGQQTDQEPPLAR
jgi:hypothetical protein